MEQTSQIRYRETEAVYIFMCLCASLIAFLTMHAAGVTLIFYRMTPVKVYYATQLICIALCRTLLAIRQSVRIHGGLYLGLIPVVMFVMAGLGFEVAEFLFDKTRMLNGLKSPPKDILLIDFLVMPAASAAWLSGSLAAVVLFILQRMFPCISEGGSSKSATYRFKNR